MNLKDLGKSNFDNIEFIFEVLRIKVCNNLEYY